MKPPAAKKPATMKIVYRGRHEAVIVRDIGRTVRRGEVISVNADVAASLLRCSYWHAADEVKRKGEQ